MAKAITKTKVVEKMKTLGTYKPEFEPAIERYVQLSKEYQTIYSDYQKKEYQYEVVGAQGAKKSPLVSTLESLRKDILNLEDALGLTPKGLLKLNEKAFEKVKKPKIDGLI